MAQCPNRCDWKAAGFAYPAIYPPACIIGPTEVQQFIAANSDGELICWDDGMWVNENEWAVDDCWPECVVCREELRP